MRALLLFSVLSVSSLAHAQDVQIIETRADATALLAHSTAAFTPGTQSTVPPRATTLRLLPEKPLQRMDGFGASLTGSSVALLLQLPEAERNAAMQDIFSPTGPLGLTLLREPIAASDFSSHGNYSYDDTPADTDLTHFSLAPDAPIFPLLRQAIAINPSLRLLILPWSAPAWMKTTHTMNGGELDSKYITPYAHYLNRTVAEYAHEGLPVYALSLQNEPQNENLTYPTQLMPARQEIALATELRPMLRASGRTTLLFGYEHNWNDIDYPRELLTTTLFDGISFHCYRGVESAQRTLLLEHPRTSLWFTECSGTYRTEFAGDLLWQTKHLLLGAPLNGARSMLIWNILLDPHGNPHNGGCTDCRPLLTVDSKGHLTRNVEFYVLAHAAPFVHPDAQLLSTTGTVNANLTTTAYRNIDGTFALIALNVGASELPLHIELADSTLDHTLPARSLTTLTWGTPTAVIAEGLYRLAPASKAPASTPSTCLTASTTSKSATQQPCTTSPAQLWTLTRLSGGRFELRNLATTQDLTKGLTLTTVDGDHVAPTILTGTPASFCLGTTDCTSPLRLLPTAEVTPSVSEKAKKE